jgi:integrase
VDSFLDWMVSNQLIVSNPLAELRQIYGQYATAPIVRALLSPNPAQALETLRPLPRFGSHLGPAMQEHIARMRALGFRYRHEGRYLRFDRFLQTRLGAAEQPLATLVREWVSLASTPALKLERLSMGRVLAQALHRVDSTIKPLPRDPLLVHEVRRRWRRPYIYTPEEVQRLLDTARRLPSPKAPLRPATVYTMLVLAYCAGLRLGEIVRLKMGDIHLDEGSIDIHETKFFKSRRLPLASSVMAVLRLYLEARQKAGASSNAEAALLWQEKCGHGYSNIAAGKLLVQVIRRAGLKPHPGRVGPRFHDLRHTFVVHRMLAWYQQGINPQPRLPYLATYLGHRDINSTLVYLTITQELLQQASDRFHAVGAKALDSTNGGLLCLE